MKMSYLLYLFAALSGLLLPGFALQAVDWEKHGLKAVETSEYEEGNRITLQDGQNRSFSVSYKNDPTDSQIERIVKLRSRFLEWTLGETKSMNLLVAGPVLEAHIIPRKIACSGRDLTDLLPGGLLFRETDSLEYNFRLTTQNLFVRIKGIFTSEKDLCEKLLAAADNPREYIRKRDPEYILRTLDRLEEELARQRLLQNRTMRAVVALHNRGFFTGPRPSMQNTIDAVVKMKEEDPSANAEAIRKKLEQSGVEITGDEIELILNVYFNEFAP